MTDFKVDNEIQEFLNGKDLVSLHINCSTVAVFLKDCLSGSPSQRIIATFSLFIFLNNHNNILLSFLCYSVQSNKVCELVPSWNSLCIRAL